MEQIVSHLTSQRKTLKQADQLEDPGRISAMIDVALISLYNRLSRIDVDLKEIRRSGAILATGEFGRRHLGPFSPITLLFLQTSDAPFEEEVWRTNIVAPLEQAGWDVQFQTATIDEAVKLGLNNFDWLGGILDSRFISGSRTLMNDLRVLLEREIGSNRGWQSIKIFLEEWQQRHNGQGDPAFILEPDLEYSAGSLGELNRIRWASYLLNGGDVSSETDSLDSDSSSTLKKAELFLLRVRNHLQLLREGQETQLQYEAQQQVALRLGYQDQGDFLAVEIMMKELEGHFYEVRLVANQFRALLREWVLAAEKEKEKPTTKKVAPGMWVESGRLMIDSQMLASDGEGLLNLFTQAVHLDLYLGAEAYQWAKSQAHQLPGDLEGTSTVRDWLFEIIREENSRIRTLRALYGTRVLSAFIPELREVHALVQHDAFHLHPVHEHHLRTFAELKKLFRGEYDSDFPQVPEWLESIRNKEVLLLAGLIHDVGKGGGHGHARRGGEMALLIGDRLGLSAEDKELLSFLVANHVLLTDNAARRDIDDEQMLQHCASVIGSVEHLKMLALHSFADLRATGPQAWEYWQDLPILELYQCLLHRLERGDPDAKAVAARLLSLKREVGELLGDEMSKEELDLHFEQLPSRYLVSATPEEVVNQYRLERQLEEAILSWQVEEKHPIWELTLMSRQPLGLLTMAAGTLTLNQLDIRKAKTHTKKNGVAFQTFEVAALKPAMEISWEQVMADLEKTIQGRLALDYRLAVLAAKQKRERKWAPAKPDEVVVDNHSSDQYTIIEVYTTDRPGLLYSITRTLLDLRLQVFLAKISTRMDQVADIFYVLTQEGQRVEDPEHAEEIKNALLFSLQ
ncbi:MAG: HD domain-containing protein [Deltaproteobacteria bacterium]|nr:HD domain-containing protein [Deltaproteobacteria bacterium]